MSTRVTSTPLYLRDDDEDEGEGITPGFRAAAEAELARAIGLESVTHQTGSSGLSAGAQSETPAITEMPKYNIVTTIGGDRVLIARNPVNRESLVLPVPDPGPPPGLPGRTCDACEQPTTDPSCRICNITVCSDCQANGHACGCSRQQTLDGGVHWHQCVLNSIRFYRECVSRLPRTSKENSSRLPTTTRQYPKKMC